MTSERIGGIRLNLETATEAELRNIAGHAAERSKQASNEYRTVMGILAMRGFLGSQDGSVDDEERFVRGEN